MTTSAEPSSAGFWVETAGHSSRISAEAQAIERYEPEPSPSRARVTFPRMVVFRLHSRVDPLGFYVESPNRRSITRRMGAEE